MFSGLSILLPRLASRVTLAVRADARDVIYLSICTGFEGLLYFSGTAFLGFCRAMPGLLVGCPGAGGALQQSWKRQQYMPGWHPPAMQHCVAGSACSARSACYLSICAARAPQAAQQ